MRRTNPDHNTDNEQGSGLYLPEQGFFTDAAGPEWSDSGSVFTR